MQHYFYVLTLFFSIPLVFYLSRSSLPFSFLSLRIFSFPRAAPYSLSSLVIGTDLLCRSLRHCSHFVVFFLLCLPVSCHLHLLGVSFSYEAFTFLIWKEYFSCFVGFILMWRRFLAGEVLASWAEPAHLVFTVFHLGCHSSPFCSHLPSRDRSGLWFVHSLSRKVHGRMYTDSSRAFSSGENCNLGTLAIDDADRKFRGCSSPLKKMLA